MSAGDVCATRRLTMAYACNAHDRHGDTPAAACPECYAEQQAEMGDGRRSWSRKRFRRTDEGTAERGAAPPGGTPAMVCTNCAAGDCANCAGESCIHACPSPAYVASLPPEAVEASRELAGALAEDERVAAAVAAIGALPVGDGRTLADVAASLPPGPRFAGIDPGARHVAVTIAAPTADRPRHVATRVFDVGRLIPLRTPKPSKVPGRAPVTHRRVVTDNDVDDLLGKVLAFLLEHGVDRVAVERATFFQRAAGGAASAAGARAALLLRSAHLGGEIAGMLRAVRAEGAPLFAVSTCSSAEWRALVRRGAGKGPWRDALHYLYGGSLPAAGEHALDAAGIAAWAGRPPEAPRTPRPPRDPGAPAGASSTARRSAKRAAARAALGCTCKGRRRHRDDCPASPKAATSIGPK